MLIPNKEYEYIKKHMPIPCVDALIEKDGKYLLVKRNNAPLKGEYFIPGGRIHLGEQLHIAIIRKVKEELNLDVTVTGLAGCYNFFFPEMHTVGFVFNVKVKDFGILKLGDESSDWKWGDIPELVQQQLTIMPQGAII